MIGLLSKIGKFLLFSFLNCDATAAACDGGWGWLWSKVAVVLLYAAVLSKRTERASWRSHHNSNDRSSEPSKSANNTDLTHTPHTPFHDRKTPTCYLRRPPPRRRPSPAGAHRPRPPPRRRRRRKTTTTRWRRRRARRSGDRRCISPPPTQLAQFYTFFISLSPLFDFSSSENRVVVRPSLCYIFFLPSRVPVITRCSSFNHPNFTHTNPSFDHLQQRQRFW